MLRRFFQHAIRNHYQKRQDGGRIVPAGKLLNVLNSVCKVISAESDVTKLINLVVSKGSELVDAEYGAFFYHVENENEPNGVLDLVAVHGAEMNFSRTENEIPSTKLLSMHNQAGSIMFGDVSTHAMHKHAQPEGHPHVRSYLAVKIVSRFGHTGSLYFGHNQPNMFGVQHEEAARAFASIASVAMDNSILYANAQREIRERNKAEKRITMMMEELNHRVKNNLATVSSIAQQTKKSFLSREEDQSIEKFCESFESRLRSLNNSHILLAKSFWVGVDLQEAIVSSISHLIVDMSRATITGPSITLGSNAATTMALVFHELAKNAVMHGAMGHEDGEIKITWSVDNDLLNLSWCEINGPVVGFPKSGGFGTRLIERGAMLELGGSAKLHYEAYGLRCEMSIPVSHHITVNA